MAIVFDTTVGADTSTSYVEVAEFNTYVEKQVIRDNLPAADDTTQIQRLLIASTDAVNSLLYSSDGAVASETQSLEYPRTGLTDRRGITILSTIIPEPLKDAVIEMAMYMHTNDMNSVSYDNWDDNLESSTINGVIAQTYKHALKPSQLVPTRVKQLIANITGSYPSNGMTAVRG